MAENNLLAEYYVPEIHHSMIGEWWKGHKWPVIPVEALPKVGVLIKSQEEYICAGFLYRTDSCIAWPEFIVSNPSFRKKETRNSALDLLIYHLTETAKAQNYKVCFISLNNMCLVRRLEKAGFKVNESGMVNMIKELA